MAELVQFRRRSESVPPKTKREGSAEGRAFSESEGEDWDSRSTRHRIVVTQRPPDGGAGCSDCMSEMDFPCSDTLLIGRSEECGLVLPSLDVSPVHARLEKRGERYWLTDLDSETGTFWCGARVGSIELIEEIPFRIGTSELTLVQTARLRARRSAETAHCSGMVGHSEAMRCVFRLLHRLSASEATVLLTGESGTGKELAARAIHRGSPRSGGPFVPVNCGALSDSLIESELFGHERGAFTGADRARKGAFEEAGGGTLFLDEIGELPLAMQAKLLRALELFEVRRVGSSRPIRVDIRVVCATNRSLWREVQDGRFREDLYWRLSALPLHLPSLRERGPEDIRALALHFASVFRAKDAPPVYLTPGAIRLLCRHSWPGNVRELRNCMMRTLLLRKSDVIDERDVALDVNFRSASSLLSDNSGQAEALGHQEDAVCGAAPVEDGEEDGHPLCDVAFEELCERLGHCVSAIARELKCSRGTVYRRLRRMGESRREGRPEAGLDAGRGGLSEEEKSQDTEKRKLRAARSMR